MKSVCTLSTAAAARTAAGSMLRQSRRASFEVLRWIATAVLALSFLLLLPRLDDLGHIGGADAVVLLVAAAFSGGLLVGLEVPRAAEPRRANRIVGQASVPPVTIIAEAAAARARIVGRDGRAGLPAIDPRIATGRRRTPRRAPRIVRRPRAF